MTSALAAALTHCIDLLISFMNTFHDMTIMRPTERNERSVSLAWVSRNLRQMGTWLHGDERSRRLSDLCLLLNS
jgi:hypothetical protein